MNAAFLAALLIAAQATIPHSMLANIQTSSGVGGHVAIRIATPSIPTKVGTAIGAIEELGPVITAENAAVIDAASGSVLWGKRPSAVRPLASITKLATALTIVRDGPALDAFVEIVSEDIPEEGHTVLQVGDRVTMGDLLTAMLVYSDNAAARALCRVIVVRPSPSPLRGEGELEGERWRSIHEYTSPSLPSLSPLRCGEGGAQIVQLLQLTSLRIVDPAGLSHENHGTAVDVARLLIAALWEEEIVKRLQQSQAVIVAERKKGPGPFSRVRIPIRSTNQLLHDGVTHAFAIVGGKTGYLDESGYNLAVAVERGGHEVIVVVLGSASDDDRFRDARVLADWTFTNYRWPS